jgi:hypothetical protein
MDAYSFGALCAWILFYIAEDCMERSFESDLEGQQGLLTAAVAYVLQSGFAQQRKRDLRLLFYCTLPLEPAVRSISFRRILSLLEPEP